MTNIDQTVANLRRNRMQVITLQTAAEVVPTIRQILPPGATTAAGGSMTLTECGVTQLLQNEYTFFNRYQPGLSADQVAEAIVAENNAQFYFSSTNALTEGGTLYNVDGRANRVSALAYGNGKLIFVVGINKIVPDLAAAVRRVKTICAPRNAVRLQKDTYCRHSGHCVALDGDMTDGCTSPSRLCCQYLATGWQSNPDRVTVILVNESLGY